MTSFMEVYDNFVSAEGMGTAEDSATNHWVGLRNVVLLQIITSFVGLLIEHW